MNDIVPLSDLVESRQGAESLWHMLCFLNSGRAFHQSVLRSTGAIALGGLCHCHYSAKVTWLPFSDSLSDGCSEMNKLLEARSGFCEPPGLQWTVSPSPQAWHLPFPRRECTGQFLATFLCDISQAQHGSWFKTVLCLGFIGSYTHAL